MYISFIINYIRYYVIRSIAIKWKHKMHRVVFNPYASSISLATGVPVPSHTVVVTSSGGVATYPVVSLPESKLNIIPPFMVMHKETVTPPTIPPHKVPVTSVAVPEHKSVVTGGASLHTSSSLKIAVTEAQKPIKKLEGYITALRTVCDTVRRAINAKKGGYSYPIDMEQQEKIVQNIEKEFKKIDYSHLKSDEVALAHGLVREYEEVLGSFTALSIHYDFV